MELLLFNVTNGLIIGAFYRAADGASASPLILNLSNVINFAHGGFLVIGGYIAYTITPYVGFWGALVIAPPLTAVIGLLVERALIRPLYEAVIRSTACCSLSGWPSLLIEDGTRFIWGAQGQTGHRARSFSRLRLSNELLLHHLAIRLFMVAVDGDRRDRRRCSRCSHRLRHSHPTPGRSTSRPWRRSASMCACCARSSFAVGIYPRRPRAKRARGRAARPRCLTWATGLLMPSFIAIIVGGVGSLPPGTLLGGLLIGVASGVTAMFFPAGKQRRSST